jgi:nitrogen regulatory protein PII
MQAVKKLEIIVDSFGIKEVIKEIEKHGLVGYSVIKDVIGKGERGLRSGDELTDVFKNSYLMTTCAPEKLDEIIGAIRPILKKQGGVCLVSDAQWVNH